VVSSRGVDEANRQADAADGDRAPRGPLGRAAGLVALAAVVALPLCVLWPWLRELSTWGFHDWDVQTSHRYLVRTTLLEHHQFPGWNPYACGGFPAWGFIEGATIVVSPWLPLYLFADLRVALRAEVLGMAILGALGAWLVAGRFTRSAGARALVVALYAVNGRWALQAAAGHTWHLAYALLPWCLLLFERAREPPARASRIALLAASFAALVYAGGIYPLPHTVLFVGLWALGLSLVERTPRPLLVLAAAGLAGVGLAAPKLLPILATMQRAPRVIASTEKLDLRSLWILLTSRDQAFYARPAPLVDYGWHEYGMYIGVAGAVVLAGALLLVGGRREAVLKAIGAALVVLGFGAFHRHAPWTWLHAHVPVFRSQHVPTRFLYPAVLALALVAASGLGRLVERHPPRRARWLDLALAALALAIGVDVALVAQKPMRDAMWMVAPDAIPRAAEFSSAQHPPYYYRRPDWAGPMYLAMLGNTGVIDCYGAPPFTGQGALARTDPRYHGEAFVDGGGAARVARWSPNRVDLAVEGAAAGARLVYNMNFDEGWSATVRQGEAARALAVFADRDRIAVALPAGASEVTLSYVPVGLRTGLALAALSSLALAAGVLWQRRRGAL
jgi:hypothetical protein